MKNKKYIKGKGFESFREFCEWFEDNDGYYYGDNPRKNGKPVNDFHFLLAGDYRKYYRAIEKPKRNLIELEHRYNRVGSIVLYSKNEKYPDFLKKTLRNHSIYNSTRPCPQLENVWLDLDSWQILSKSEVENE